LRLARDNDSGVIYEGPFVDLMSIWRGFLEKIGFAPQVERSPISVFLLDDDRRRHEWFRKRFKGDYLEIAEGVEEALTALQDGVYDAIFLDHDLLPEHYKSSAHDDERTGYAIAKWLAEHPALHRASYIIVHTRNADGAIRMVEILRDNGREAEYVPFPFLEHKIRRYWQR
jgi:hypothetical protein